MKTSCWVWLFGTVLFMAMLVFQWLGIQSWQPNYVHNYMVVSDPRVARVLSCGNTNMMSDLQWIWAIQYYGGNYTTLQEDQRRDESWNRMTREKSHIMRTLVDNVLILDPYFQKAYEFAGFVFSNSMGEYQEAIDMLLQGLDRLNEPEVMEAFPDRYELPYQAAFIARYRLDDIAQASQLYYKASEVASDDQAAWLRRLALQSERLTGVDNTVYAVQELMDQYQRFSHPTQREIIKNQAQRIIYDDYDLLYRVAQEVYFASFAVEATNMCQIHWTPGVMQTAALEFRDQTQRLPFEFREYDDGSFEVDWFLSGLPSDPFGGDFVMLGEPPLRGIASNRYVAQQRHKLIEDIQINVSRYVSGHGPQLPQDEKFWEAIGYHDPVRDPWGIPAVWIAEEETIYFPPPPPPCNEPPDGTWLSLPGQ